MTISESTAPDLRRSSSASSRPGRAATSTSSPPGSCSSPSSSARPPTCRPAGACSTSPPAAATPRSPPRGTAATRSASTTCRPCSTAVAAGPRPRASTVGAARGRRRGAAVPGRLLRRRPLGLRRRCSPRTTSRRRPELLRVCRPGGTIALASWTPDGFIGELLTVVAAHVPPPAGVRRRCSGAPRRTCASCSATQIAALEVTERTFTFRFRSAEDFVTFFRPGTGRR